MDDVDDSATVAVAAQGLTKRFGDFAAVNDLSLTVPAGVFYGVVGLNGAGKTTTMKMLTGQLRPDAGSATVAGVDVWAPHERLVARQRIGVLPDELPLFERLTGEQNLEYTGALRAMPAATVNERARDLLDVLDLEGAAKQLVMDYSTGMRKKLALAMALLHTPAVIFLDEPFESIDPVSASTIRDVLTAYRDGGGTIVFSSHVIATVERLCDRVAVVHHGQIVAEDAVAAVAAARADGIEGMFFDAVKGAARATSSLTWLRASA